MMCFKKTAHGWEINGKKIVRDINGLLIATSPVNKEEAAFVNEKLTKKEQKQ